MNELQSEQLQQSFATFSYYLFSLQFGPLTYFFIVRLFGCCKCMMFFLYYNNFFKKNKPKVRFFFIYGKNFHTAILPKTIELKNVFTE